MDLPRNLYQTKIAISTLLLWCISNGPIWSQAGPSQWFDCHYTSTTQCDGTVPSLFVDLRNDPSQKWYSCKLGRGQKDSTCCNIIIGNNDQCIEFKVLVHPQTQAILLQVPESSEPEWQNDVAWYNANFPQPPNPPSPPSPGAKPSINTYRINCGPLQGGAQGNEPACLTSSVLNDTIFITFCQTGNNDNVYRIKTIRAEVSPDVEILAEGCGNSVTVSATDIDVSSITWNSTQNPAYNAYLSSTCCDTTITVAVPKGAALPPGNPPVLTYEMCADPIGAGFCPTLMQICTTVQVVVLSPPDIIVNAPTVCPEGIFYAEVTNQGSSVLEYTWYDGPDGTGSSFPTGNTDNYTYSSPGNKSVIVVDPTIQTFGYDECAYDTVNFLISTFPTPLAEINGPTDICILVPYNFTATNDGLGQSYNWNFGSGAIPASFMGTNNAGRNPPAVQWSTCGDKTIRLIVTSVNGCRDTAFYTVFGDVENPVIICPGNVSIECDQTPTPALTGQATATDNCGVYISFSDNIVPGICPGEYTIERTWVATDSCDNSDQCLQLINVVDTEPPVVNCVVTDLVLECDQNYTAEINTWILNTTNDLYANASDNCGTISIDDDWNGALPTIDCNGSTGLVVTFTISDDCDNDTICTGLIIIDDTQPPVVNCNADDLILECGDDYLALINSWITSTEADLLNVATDACGGPLTVTNDWDNVSVPTIDCNGTNGLTVIFTILDACLNPTLCQADIILNDTEPPIVTCNVPNLVLECDQDYISEISAWIATVEAGLESTSSDLCSSSLVADNLWNGSDVPTLDCDGTTGLTITFTVTDDCGNVTSCDALVTLDDTSPPVVICNVIDLVLECDQDYNQEIIDWLALSEANLLSVAIDDCNQPLTADNDWDGTLPTLDCSGTSGVPVVFIVTDACGNTTSCSANIYVIDSEPPIVTCVTSDLVLECDQDYLTEIQNWINTTEADILTGSSDDCGQTLTITNDWNGTDVPTLDCNGTSGLTVTFTVLDACLNPTPCTALVIIDDTTPPTVTFPGDYALNGCDVGAITDLPFSLTELTITLGQFQGLGGSVTESCNSSFTITYQDSIIAICPLTVRRLFRVTDECGNQTLGPQIITISDIVPPSITCPGPITGEGCNTVDVGAVTGFDFATDTTIIDPADFIAIDFVSFVFDNCGIRELNYIDAIIQQSCPLQIERTFTVYDSCNLSNSCVSLITIQDTQAPTIVCPADVINEGCDVSAIQTWTSLPFSTTVQIIDENTFDNLDGPSEASDICGILEVHYIDVIVQLTCPLLVDRTFIAFDSCGLNSTCTQRIEIQDTEPPSITCPDEAIGEGCDVSAVLGISGLAYSAGEVIINELTFDNLDGPSEAFDLCGIREVRYSDVIIQPSCPLLIDRTFTAYDSCGLNSSCVQRIIVEDTQVPILICPGPVDGEGCDVTAIAGLAQLPFQTTPTPVLEGVFESLDALSDALDVCGIFEITYQDSIAQPSCPLIVIRTFTAYDSCGLNTSCTQQITVRDLTPPVISCAPPVTLEGCNTGDLTALTGLDFATIETFIDEFTFENSILPGQVSDNCGILEVGYIDNIINPSCPLVIQRLFTAYDSCGLTDTCTWTITIDDTTPPVITCPDQIVGEGCTVDDLVVHTTLPYSPIEAIIDENTFDNLDGPSEASDICGILEVRYIDVIVQATCPLLIDRTFTAYDSCGLNASCTQRIEIQDTEVPVIVCPAEVSGEGCDVGAVIGISGLAYSGIEVIIDELTFDNLDGPSEAFDVCGIREVRYIDVIVQPSCPLLIDRTFTAYDSCGLNSSCVQRIIVEDTQVPVIICPGPVEGEGCDVTAIAGISGLIYTDIPLPIDEGTFELLDGISDASDICGIFEITYQDSIAQPSCPLIVVRTFTAYDSCGLNTSCTQLITVRDLTPPVINCAAPVTLEGCNTGDLGALTGLDFATIETFIDEFTFENSILPGQVSDNCGILEIGYIDNILNPSCPLVIQRLFTAYDSCGLTDTCSWTLTIDDTTPPTITCPASIVGEGCSVDDLVIHTTLPYSPTESVIDETTFDNLDGLSEAEDICGILEVRYIDVIVQATCPLLLDRTFTAYDSCGLYTSCTQRIEIRDTEVPLITCPADVMGEGCDVSAVIGISGLPYSAIEATIDELTFDNLDGPSEAFDVCGILEVRYIDVIVQPSCPLLIDRTFTAYDSCGLNSACVQRITVEDTQVPVITCPDPVEGEGCDVNAIGAISGLIYSSIPITIGEPAFELLDGISDVFDVCGIFEIIYQDSIAQESCPLIVVRRFTAFDSCGLNASCTQQITVRDLTPPSITCAAPITLEGCNTADLLSLTGLAFSPVVTFIDEFTFENATIPGQVSDNCGILQVGYIDNVVNPSCPLIIERLFTAYDSCGLTDTCTWRITVDDTTPPSIICPDNITQEGCSVTDLINLTNLAFSPVESSISEVAFNNLDATSQVSDICGITEVRYIDVIFQESCPLVIDRTFTAYDSCGLNTSCTQRIIVEDTQSPFLACPDDVTAEGCDLSALLGATGLAYSGTGMTISEATFDALDDPSEASDACGVAEITYVDLIVQASCPLTIDRTFTVYDSCGLNTSCTQRIIIEDTEIPQIICPAAVEGEGCDVNAITSISGLAYSPSAQTVAPAIFINLDPISDVNDVCGIMSINYQDIIQEESCPLVVLRTFTAYDSCGLFTQCTQLITVRDTQNPTITCPSDINIDACFLDDLEMLTTLEFSSIERSISKAEFDALDGASLAEDLCGVFEVGYVDELVQPNCPIIIRRTFTAYDSCGLTAVCTQNIQLNPIPIIDPSCPAPLVTATCLTQSAVDQLFIDWVAQFAYNGPGCNLQITSLDTVTAPEFCGGSRSITFVVEDQCGNQTSCSSSFTVPIAPVLVMTCPSNIIVQCPSDIPLPYNTISQFESAGGVLTNYCGLVANSFALIEETSDGNSCPEIITRIYEVEDFCGHIKQCTQLITVNDTISPQLVGVPEDLTVACDQVPDPPILGVEITVDDNCDQILPSFTEEIIEGICENTYNIVRTWTATDACGNAVSATQNITVVDCRPDINIMINPNPACLNGSVTFSAIITSNYTNPIYRWQFLWNGTWVDLPGGNTVPFIINNVDLEDVGIYRLLVADKLQNIFNFDCNVISDEAQLDVIRPVVTNLIDSICEDDTYLVGMSSYTESGSYQDTLIAFSGCDSIVNLDLTVLPNTEGSLDTTICAGERLIIGETVLRNDGLYKVHLPNAAGCDSTVSVRLRIRVPEIVSINDTICEGETTTIGGDLYSETGNYTKILTDSYGCDSTLQISLYVIPRDTTLINVTICTGDTYLHAGQSFNTSGVHEIRLISNMTGCDSIVIIILQVVDQINISLLETICIGDSFQLGAQFYNTTGTYRDTFISSAGCDSIVTLNLAVVPEFVTNLSKVICEGESIQVGTKTYTSTGNYTDLLMSSGGCDSIINLDLLVHPTADTLIVADVCSGQSFIAGGQSFASSGVFDIITQTKNGCDSLIKLDLTVHPSYDTLYTINLCLGETFLLGGDAYDSSGIYSHTFSTTSGCDSVIILDLNVTPIYVEDRSITICKGSTYQVGPNSYDQSGNYFDTLSTVDGCDSIINLQLTVVDTISVDISVQICDGEGYVLDDISYTETGLYTATFISSVGCDSVVTLMLEVLSILRDTTEASICAGEIYDFDGTSYNTAGIYQKSYTSLAGCDSIHTLILQVVPAQKTNVFEEICEGDSLAFGTVFLKGAGTYIDTLFSQAGCDSIVTLNLRVRESKTTILNKVLCADEIFTFAGQSLDTMGTYTDTLSTADGCDSVVILNLQINSIYSDTITQQICEGQIFTFNGQLISESGEYVAMLQTDAGCDSMVMLNLSVLSVLRDTTRASICGSEPYIFDGTAYTQAGIYHKTYSSAAGCDSIQTLILEVRAVSRTDLLEEICTGESFQLGSKVITSSGIFSDTLTSASGCDSIVTLTLRINDPKMTNLTRNICSGEVFNFQGLSLDSSGIYVDTLISSEGCDSIVNLNLTVYPTYFQEIPVQICQGQSYGFDGQALSISGDYTARFSTKIGCDSIVVLHLAVVDVLVTDLTETICNGSSLDFFGQTLNAPGNYSHTLASTAGCDSMVNLHLELRDEIRLNLEVSMCEGESYQFGDKLLTESATYIDTFTSTNGCDSIVTLDLQIGPVFRDTIREQICFGTTYIFAGQSLTASGMYVDSLQSSLGCDSVIVLDLSVEDIKKDTLIINICAGEIVTFEGEEYGTTGIYEKKVAGVECDTLKVLVLNVLDELMTSTTHQICRGGSYFFDGQDLSMAGTYSMTLESAEGCDSTVNLILEIVDAIHVDLNYAICSGDTVRVNGKIYTSEGSYTDTLMSTGGCDSILIINVEKSGQKVVTLSDTICEGTSYTFGNRVYLESVTVSDTFQTAFGCDSIVQLVLTVTPRYEEKMAVALCNGSIFRFDGIEYDQPGTYDLRYQTVDGCDSTITLDISITDQIVTELSVQNCLGASYDFNGRLILESGIYRDTFSTATGCDSVVVLNYELTNVLETYQTSTICQGDSILINGTYYLDAVMVSDTNPSILGCDSIAYHEIIVLSDISLLGHDALICAGESVQLNVEIQGILSGPVHWTPSADLSCDDCLDPVATPGSTTIYQVSTTGCLEGEIKAQFTVEVIPLPQLLLSENQNPDGGQEIVLSAVTDDPSNAINWFSESGDLICANCTSILHTPGESGTYIAIAVNSLGCETSAEISVSLDNETVCDVGAITASNAMTPNGDGYNDFFQIINEGDAVITLVQIFNRWGETIFESRGQDEQWDGTIHGQPVNPGVFVYLISGDCVEGDFQLIGNVTVIR